MFDLDQPSPSSAGSGDASAPQGLTIPTPNHAAVLIAVTVTKGLRQGLIATNSIVLAQVLTTRATIFHEAGMLDCGVGTADSGIVVHPTTSKPVGCQQRMPNCASYIDPYLMYLFGGLWRTRQDSNL